MTPILFCRDDSAYKNRQDCDVYDKSRNALTYNGSDPVIAHPPCRAWGCLSHMAKPEAGERELAIWAVGVIRKNGGILEHPAKSKLWAHCGLPYPNGLPDGDGGFSVLVDQYAFGHVANKPTNLYIVGAYPDQLPAIPRKHGRASKSITGQVPNTTRCTQYEREYTPEALIDWMLAVCKIIKANKVNP